MSTLDYQSPGGQDSGDDDNIRRDESTLQQLKKLLLGDEQTSIADLDQRIQEVESSQSAIAELRSQLDSLKSALISREEMAEKLAELELDPDQLSRLLPEAIRDASGRDDELSAALSPTLAESFQQSVKRDPESLADAVSPIMGPAIRRSISQAIAAMVQSLNQSIEHSFSPRGLKWRWEAFTTGKPFAEVVLLHSLVYRVEHVFLIRHEDGVVLSHVTNLPEDQVDPDMVSGMLTALQDFVVDSLGGAQSDELEELQVGDRNIFVEHGSDAIVATVIRGIPPEAIRESMQEVCEKIHINYSKQFDQFKGDTTPFEASTFELRELLQSAYHEKENKPGGSKFKRLGWAAAGLLVAAGLVWWFLAARHRRIEHEITQRLAAPESVEVDLLKGVLSLKGEAHDDWIRAASIAAVNLDHVDRVDSSELANKDRAWHDCLQQLRAEPGIVITEAYRDGCVYILRGMQDPLARSAEDIIAASDVEPGQIRATWTPYRAAEPQFAVGRVRQALDGAEDIHWNQNGNTLTASGRASDSWCKAAARLAANNDDVRVDISDVINIDRQALSEKAAAIEQFVVLHQNGSQGFAEGQEALMDEIATRILELTQAADALQEAVRVIVVSYADKDERLEWMPQNLSEKRARLVWKELTDREVNPERLFVRARGASRPQNTDSDEDQEADMRRTTFSVKLGP